MLTHIRSQLLNNLLPGAGHDFLSFEDLLNTAGAEWLSPYSSTP